MAIPGNTVIHTEVLEERARELGDRNGLKLVFVTLEPGVNPTSARLDLEFYNSNVLPEIFNAVNTDGTLPTEFFTIRGGTRIKGGQEFGQVQVTAVLSVVDEVLSVRVEPIGDYSTYTLHVEFAGSLGDDLIDPLLDEIQFKFRPGCFNLNCAPEGKKGNIPQDKPVIDYLAKDFDSFKHVLINAMRERVPDWQPTSEADLDMVFLDLLAADGDEISDFQDRVMQEAYFGRARKRVSLARHARLMDYHIHQGNQSGTWMAFQTSGDLTVPWRYGVWTGSKWDDPRAVIFITQQRAEDEDEIGQLCFQHLNELQLYTWDNAITALDKGAVEADLALPGGLVSGSELDANILRDLFRRSDIRYLVIEEKLNPETGLENEREIKKRQLLQLLEGDLAAETLFDPSGEGGIGAHFVRVRWRPEDALTTRYCFVTRCADEPPTPGISAFHGNIIWATHGRPHRTTFKPAGEELGASDNNMFERIDEVHYEATPWGVVCKIPHPNLAYRNTLPGGEVRPATTLTVDVEDIADPWEEQIDLIESEDNDEHFVVETDEMSFSRIRFGFQRNGRPLPQDAEVIARYQVGRGSEGNIGAGQLTGFDPVAVVGVDSVHNPFDVTDGRDPEPVVEILRRVPEAYRSRQRRAVTLQDYVDQAESLQEVSHAYAHYAWTGSWRTVRVSIDPAGTDELLEPIRLKIESHLNALRLIGEDLEIRQAQYVALDIEIRLCAHPDYWPEDLAAELDQEFSDGYTFDGRRGFFHPDEWTFGQPLHASQLVGRALSVPGVGRALSVSMRRWNAGLGPTTSTIILNPEDLPENIIDALEVHPNEVIRVSNDPSHIEKGRILFDIEGGRQ